MPGLFLLSYPLRTLLYSRYSWTSTSQTYTPGRKYHTEANQGTGRPTMEGFPVEYSASSTCVQPVGPPIPWLLYSWKLPQSHLDAEPGARGPCSSRPAAWLPFPPASRSSCKWFCDKLAWFYISMPRQKSSWPDLGEFTIITTGRAFMPPLYLLN